MGGQDSRVTWRGGIRASMAGVLAIGLFAGLGAGARGAATVVAPTGSAIFFNRSTTPADTYAVAPDGSGLSAVGCSGDRTDLGSPRRILRVETAGGQFPAYTEALALRSYPIVELVARDEACGDPRVLAGLGAGYRLGDAAWSLDGGRVAFVAEHYDTAGQLLDQGVWVGDLTGACGTAVCGLRLASSLPMTPVAGQGETGGLVAYYEHTPFLKWASDGRRVVYSRRFDPAASTLFGVFVADLGVRGSTAVSGDVRVSIAGGASQQLDPAFSPLPGDDRIAFVQTTSTKGCIRNDIFVTTSAGGAATQVTTNKNANVCQLGRPDWSPDGLWLAFDAAPLSLAGQGIYKIRVDGSAKATQLTLASGVAYYAPRWRR